MENPPDSDDAPGPSGAPFTPRRCLARISDELLHSRREARSNRTQRHDGWTPERIRTFLETLAACGVVEDSARAAGMSVRSCYNLRNHARGAAFAIAWTAAQQRARQRLADEVSSRALNGCVEIVMRDGEVIGERHRFDNKLTMAVLDRLDRQLAAADDDSRTTRVVAREFDEFLDIACDGGEGAAEFIASRFEADLFHSISRNARVLDRLDEYLRRAGELADGTQSAAEDGASDPPVTGP